MKANFNIIIDSPITNIREVYLNLMGRGNFRKMFNTTVNAEFAAYSDGTVDITSIIDGSFYTVNDKFSNLTYKKFVKNFPNDGWNYGYIQD